MRRKGFLTYWLALGAGHLIVDLSGGMIPPVLPKLMERFDTGLLGASSLVTVFALGANFAQMPLGHAGDRSSAMRRLMVLAPVVACVPLFLGFVHSYVLLCALLLIGGAAVALFHPTSIYEVQTFSGMGRGALVSVFMALGFLGFAGGSLVGAKLGETFGLEWMWLPILPAVVVSVALFFAGRRHHETRAPAREGDRNRAEGYSFRAVWLAAVFVAFVSNTFVVLMPTYTNMTFRSVIPGGAAVLFFGVFGAVGGVAFGWLSDRLPRGYVCAAALLISTGFLSAFFLVKPMTLVLFSLAGLGIGSAFPLLIAMSHEAKGRGSNLRNGLMVGGCWGLAALLLPLVGAASDAWGLANVLPWISIFTPMPALMMILAEMSLRRRNAQGDAIPKSL